MPQGLLARGWPQQLAPTSLLRSHRVAKASPHLCCAQGPGSVDYGTEDEDGRLVKEFESLKSRLNPENNVKNAVHLNLLWSISEVSRGALSDPVPARVCSPAPPAPPQRKRPERCECCSGSGERECVWCHGTGAMTVGDTLYCSETGCSPCPVCRGRGTCKCEACRGAGKRAAWMGPDRGCESPY